MSWAGLFRIAVLSGCVVATGGKASAYEHFHVDAGAVSTEPGSALIFDGADQFLASSGYVWEMEFREAWDLYGGYFVATNLTFTALPATVFYGGPEGFHAAPGADLHLQVVSVSGPAGGAFGFWEWTYTISPEPGATPTASFSSGSFEPTAGGGLFAFALTEAAPDDPYGHIHDRAYSATVPGVYDVGFRIVDASGHHADSAVYTFRFAAVPEPGVLAMVVLAGAMVLVRWIYRRREPVR